MLICIQISSHQISYTIQISAHADIGSGHIYKQANPTTQLM